MLYVCQKTPKTTVFSFSIALFSCFLPFFTWSFFQPAPFCRCAALNNQITLQGGQNGTKMDILTLRKTFLTPEMDFLAGFRHLAQTLHYLVRKR